MEKPILIQGAMNIETELFIHQLEKCEKMVINGYEFFSGLIHNHHVVVAITKIGSIHAAVSTILAINQFHPQCIINQGVAGGHPSEVHQGDIVLGKYVANLNSYLTSESGEGEGMHPEHWKLVSFQEGNDIKKEKIEANSVLLEKIQDYFQNQLKNKVHVGTIASGDAWNREADRIHWFVNEIDSKCEDMESYSVYKVCLDNKIPVLSIRIISNSQINGERYNKSTADHLQKILSDYLKMLE